MCSGFEFFTEFLRFQFLYIHAMDIIVKVVGARADCCHTIWNLCVYYVRENIYSHLNHICMPRSSIYACILYIYIYINIYITINVKEIATLRNLVGRVRESRIKAQQTEHRLLDKLHITDTRFRRPLITHAHIYTTTYIYIYIYIYTRLYPWLKATD